MVEPIVLDDAPGRQTSLWLALEDVVMSEFRRGPGEPGPDLHVHRLHADCFYVLDGSLTLSLLDGDRVIGPGTFALVPPNVVHTFDCPDETRFLNFHTPGMGFDLYMRDELGAPFDQHPPPADGGTDPASVLVRTAETDSVTPGEDARVGILAGAEDSLGALSLVEYAAPPSFPGPPVHLHERTWDAYYVIEGLLSVRLGDDRHELGPGDVAVVPPGTVHGFANPLGTPTRFLDVHAPGGFEDFFREFAIGIEGGPREPAVLAEIASRYDMILA